MSLPKEWVIIEQERAHILSEAVKFGQLTTSQSEFVDLIIVDTLPAEQASLSKVKAALELAPILQKNGVNDGKMLYVGAGRDWRFPIALGGRDIVMMGLADVKEGVMTDILNHDPKAVINGDSVSFATPFSEDIRITIVNADVKSYKPDFPIKTLLEYAGPTKLPGMGGKKVMNLISEQLGDGALLLNFDQPIHKNDWSSPDFFRERGIKQLGNPNFRFAQIVDAKLAKKWVGGSIPDPEISLPGSMIPIGIDDI